MASKPDTNPRKSASQERSRSTVDALLEATTRILIKEGYDKASTNRIAELAGVSIGSLYQYFPSKEALVAAVIDRHTQRVSQVAGKALMRMAALPIEEAAREFVSVAIDSHRVNPRLHAVLSEQIPRVGRLENIEANIREGYALVRGYLEAHRDEIDVADPDIAAFICVTVVEALTHAAVLRRPDMLSDGKAEQFVEDATRLLVGYLRKS
ncbi:MAG TPA: TetR/AcrR family transcriptional regulator [Candidatus Binataceae bacterium]|nr:TetR/AcrR family transcriptional regulator [Candidatus Binataceae bacterium]